MSRRPPLLGIGTLRHVREQRSQRLLAVKSIRDALVSVAGLIGRPVANPSGAEVGRLVDLVARWADDPYPPITGLVVRVGRRAAFIDVAQVAELGRSGVSLRSARFDLRDFERRSGEVLLARDVLDHQLVDVDGKQVVRAADLYVARVMGVLHLVGVDVGFRTLLRRLGPTRWRNLPTPERVIDWGAIQPFGGPVSEVRLTASARELHRLRPAELADLLEDLERPARQELLAVLEPEVAADALEEMDPGGREALLRESEPETAAALVAEMEPDEAAGALRDLDAERRDELLERMPPETARDLIRLLEYSENTAGGIMTTTLVHTRPSETVGALRARMRELEDLPSDIGGVIVVDDDGRLVDDVGVLEIFLADPAASLESLVGPPWPTTVTSDASIEEIAMRLLDNRGSSVVVVDEGNHPLGRIHADDVIDSLVPERGRLHFPRFLQ